MSACVSMPRVTRRSSCGTVFMFVSLLGGRGTTRRGRVFGQDCHGTGGQAPYEVTRPGFVVPHERSGTGDGSSQRHHGPSRLESHRPRTTHQHPAYEHRQMHHGSHGYRAGSQARSLRRMSAAGLLLEGELVEVLGPLKKVWVGDVVTSRV